MVSKSVSRRGERKQQLRAEILAAAGRLSAKVGFENVTLRAIADEIGYSHATIYQYFTDKSQILSELCFEAFQLMVHAFDEIAGKTSDPRERLFATSKGMIYFCIAHPDHLRAGFLQAPVRAGLVAGQFIADVGRPLFDRMIEAFVQAVNAEEIQLAEPTRSAITWGHSIFGLAIVLTVSGSPRGDYPNAIPHEQTIDEQVQWLWAGVTASRLR